MSLLHPFQYITVFEYFILGTSYRALMVKGDGPSDGAGLSPTVKRAIATSDPL